MLFYAQMFEYFGLVLVIVSWATIAYLVLRARNTSLLTISRHAASSRTASLIFAGLLVGLGLLFYLWLLGWLVPRLGLGSLFIAALTLMTLCQFATGLARDTRGLEQKIHCYAAYSMAVLYLPLVLMVVAAPGISALARYVDLLIWIYMLVSFGLVALAGNARSRYLAFQASYVVAFQCALLVAAYL